MGDRFIDGLDMIAKGIRRMLDVPSMGEINATFNGVAGQHMASNIVVGNLQRRISAIEKSRVQTDETRESSRLPPIIPHEYDPKQVAKAYDALKLRPRKDGE